MKRTTFLFGMAVIFGAGAPLAAGDAASEPEGKAIFLASKCQGCHTVASQQIGLEQPAAGGAEDEEATDDVKPPDLSGVGLKHKADFLDGFLRKQATLHGRKHRRRFPGTKEERAKLVAWLVTLKTEAQAAPPARK